MAFDLKATAIEPDYSAVEVLVHGLENQAARKAVS